MHCFTMKTRIKLQNQEIAFNHLSDIDFKDLLNICKKFTANPLRFRKNLLEKIWELIITIADKIRKEKLQYHIKKVAANILRI